MTHSTKRKSKRSKGKESKSAPTKAHVDQQEDSTPGNFGGLPSRDLKKNLGCG